MERDRNSLLLSDQLCRERLKGSLAPLRPCPLLSGLVTGVPHTLLAVQLPSCRLPPLPLDWKGPWNAPCNLSLSSTKPSTAWMLNEMPAEWNSPSGSKSKQSTHPSISGCILQTLPRALTPIHGYLAGWGGKKISKCQKEYFINLKEHSEIREVNRLARNHTASGWQ